MLITATATLVVCLILGLIALFGLLSLRLCFKTRPAVAPQALKEVVVAPQSSSQLAAIRRSVSNISSIPLQMLMKATGEFSADNILGTGKSAIVYRGNLNQDIIAVKRLAPGTTSPKLLQAFYAEIRVLKNLNHINIVSLIGYCKEEDEKILVYEYVPQGTLNDHLFNRVLAPLNWKTRAAIALDAARGLEYMHHLAPKTFIHGNLNASNIRLGEKMKAKIAGFGLTRIAPRGEKCSIEIESISLSGSFGYIAPEIADSGTISTKSDVYSFGVVLMQLVSGRKATYCTKARGISMVAWFNQMIYNPDTFQHCIDPLIEVDEKEANMKSIKAVAELAALCCQRTPMVRPDMGHVVNRLTSLVEVTWRPPRRSSSQCDEEQTRPFLILGSKSTQVSV